MDRYPHTPEVGLPMVLDINASFKPDREDSQPPPLNILAVAKANHATYLALTGNRFSVEIGERTCFNHDRLKVVIGAEQLLGLGITNQLELHFIILHELGHLKEFRDDAVGYRAMIGFCQQHPDGREIFSLYNSLMDVYVNHNTANKAAAFSDGQGGFSDLVKELYLTKAFPEHDLTTEPLATQYVDYLLLSGMGVGRAYTVAEPIREIINAGLTFCGQHYNYEDFTQAFLVPAIGTHKTDVWHASISQRSMVIQATILPIFLELLKRDKARGRESGDGPGEDTSSLGPEGARAGIGGGGPSITHTFSPEELEKVLETIMSIAEQENMSSQEKAEHDLRRQATQIAEAAKTANPADFADRLVRVQPFVNQLVNEFLKIHVRSKQLTRAVQTYSTIGNLHVPEAIRKFSKVQKDPENADVMRRESVTHSVDKAPINIRLCLLPDLSGSMGDCVDGLKDNVIALAATVATLCGIHKRERSGIVSELAIYGFDDSLHEILDPLPDASLKHVASSYGKLQPRGGTHEYLALEHLITVLDRLAPIDQKKGPGRQTINVAISLTDGDTEGILRSIEAKNELLRRGVECFGVFLRSVSSNSATFRHIWGERAYEIASVDQLPRIISQIGARITSR